MPRPSADSKPRLFGAGPVLAVPDVARAVAFYRDVLGFEVDFVMGEPPAHGSVTRDRVGIQFTRLATPFSPGTYPGWTYLFLANVDALYREYSAETVVITRALRDHDHGMREFEIEDAFGYRLRFGQYLQE